MELLLITGQRSFGKTTAKKLRIERPYWNISVSNMGTDARTVLQDNNFDAAIVDIYHSNGEAFNMISELSANHPSLPVIAISSSFSNGLMEKTEMYCDSSCICNINDNETCINAIERACK